MNVAETSAVAPDQQLSVAVSIVLYKSRYSEIQKLITELLEHGVSKVFVVDNSPLSFDTFEATASTAAVEHLRVGRNLGYGRAHNLAILQSVQKFKYHIVCNPDISLAPNAIATLIEYMNEHVDVGLCMPRLIGLDGLEQYCCRRAPLLWDYVSQLIFPKSIGLVRRKNLEMRDCNYDQEMEVDCLSGCFMLFRSDVLKALNGFDPHYFMYFEDFDLSMRSRLVARNVYLPLTYVVHGRSSEHRRSWRLRIAFAVSAMRFFRRWGMFRRNSS